MPFADPTVSAIAAFLDRIGIPVIAEAVPGDSLLPGATVRDGALVFDPERLPYPGDLLHEAGHIAVTDPALRPTLCEVPSDPGEEMAAIAWSYAAALEIGIDPAIVFHDDGYQGGGGYLLPAFADGGGPGVPMLQYYEMTLMQHPAAAAAPFPAMRRWLR